MHNLLFCLINLSADASGAVFAATVLDAVTPPSCTSGPQKSAHTGSSTGLSCSLSSCFSFLLLYEFGVGRMYCLTSDVFCYWYRHFSIIFVRLSKYADSLACCLLVWVILFSLWLYVTEAEVLNGFKAEHPLRHSIHALFIRSISYPLFQLPILPLSFTTFILFLFYHNF